MARSLQKTAKGSGGGKNNTRGREWTKEELREFKRHSRQKTPVATISKLTKRTIGALRQKAFKLGLPLGRKRFCRAESDTAFAVQTNLPPIQSPQPGQLPQKKSVLKVGRVQLPASHRDA